MGKRNWIPFFAIIPSVVLVLGIAIYPIGYAIYLSLTNRMMQNPEVSFIGLENYISNLTNAKFWQYVQTTALFVLISVALELLLGFGLALLLNQNIRGRSVFRVIMLVPLMIPPVTAALMWKVMLDASTGPINYFIHCAHRVEWANLAGIPHHGPADDHRH